MVGLVRRFRVMALLVLTHCFVTFPATGQSRPPPTLPRVATAEEGRIAGWLGVRVEERVACGPNSGGRTVGRAQASTVRQAAAVQAGWQKCDLVIHVREIQPDGPAAIGGLLVGDKISAIDGFPLTTTSTPILLDNLTAGRPVQLNVERGGTTYSLQVVPGDRPPNPGLVPMRGHFGDEPATSFQGEDVLLMLADSIHRVAMQRHDTVAHAMAIVLRDTEFGVSVEPSVARFMDGQLEMRLLSDAGVPEYGDTLPADVAVWSDLQEELETLREAMSIAYTTMAGTLDRVREVRSRSSPQEFRRRVAQLAGTALGEARLVVRFRRTFAGAEFEAVRNPGGQNGLLVLDVVEGTAAARLGLRPGDLVVRVGDRPVRTVEALIEAIGVPGSSPAIVVWLRGEIEMRAEWAS